MRDGGIGQAGNGDDVAGLGFIDRNAVEAAEGEHLGNAAGLDQLALMVKHLHRLVRLHRAGGDAARDDTAEKVIGLDDGAEQTERAFFDLR